MPDLYHWLGEDLETSAQGDLRPVDGVDRGRQRVIRRLLTVPGRYLHHPTYGAGLQLYIGQPVDEMLLVGLIRSQIYLESCVTQVPPPLITVQSILNGYAVTVAYVDTTSGEDVVAQFDVSA